jgi:drug/metabolite transporter (DMT)-like permease
MTFSLKSVSVIDLLLLIVMTIWGLNLTVAKFALQEMNPLTFNSLRFAFASLVLLILTALSKSHSRLDRRTLAYLFLIGIIGNGGQIAVILGLYRTLAIIAALILASTPIFVSILNEAFGTERLDTRGWVGVFASFLGIILMMNLDPLGREGFLWTLVGDLLVLVGTFCWALYTVLSRPILSSVRTLQFVTYTVALGTPLLLIVSIPSLVTQDFRTISWMGWTAVAFSSTLAVAFGYVVWYSGVRKIGSTRTAIYQNLTTLAAILFASQLLGERLFEKQIVGAALLFLGIYFTRFSKQREGRNLACYHDR